MEDLKRAVEVAAHRDDVRAAVENVYRAVEAQIQSRRPLCAISGKCCRFEDYGHRLYVTTLELAVFYANSRTASTSGTLAGWDGTGCPYQQNKLCSVHAIRPFGCRMFFCDPTATEWQNEQYERFHADLKRLHETLQVPYFYVEWRKALEEICR